MEFIFYLRYSSQLISWFLFLHWIINIHFTIFSFIFISFHCWHIFYFLFYYCSVIRINNSFNNNSLFVWLEIKKNDLSILWIVEILISFHFKKRIEFNFNDTVYRMNIMNLENINQHSAAQWNQMNNTFAFLFPKDNNIHSKHNSSHNLFLFPYSSHFKNTTLSHSHFHSITLCSSLSFKEIWTVQ